MNKIVYMLYILVLAILMSNCGGSIGKIAWYIFDANQYQVDNNINSLLEKDTSFKVPDKWKKVIDYKAVAQPHLQYSYFYFKSPPEEVLAVRWAGRSKYQNLNQCTLGLIYKYDGNKWYKDEVLDSDEKKRLMKRFEEEVLYRLDYSCVRDDSWW